MKDQGREPWSDVKLKVVRVVHIVRRYVVV